MPKLKAELYPVNWEELATAVKDKAGWKCQNCDHPHDPGHGYCLTVHHIDRNPANSKPWNLVALCQKCHLHYQRPRNLYQSTMFGYPDWLTRYFNALGLNSSLSPDFSNTILPSPVSPGSPGKSLKPNRSR